MGLFLATIFAGILVMTAFHYWRRLCDEEPLIGDEWNLFLRWVGTGLFVPVALWFILNTGFLGAPVWPNVAPLPAGLGVWWKSFSNSASGAVFLISSYWAGVTFLWLLGRLFERVENRGAFLSMCAAWSLVLLPGAAVVIFVGGWAALGLAILLCGIALVHTTLTLKNERPLAPSYARAQARISFGKYEEAEMEVIYELERCEEDFDGWMMLAELYATHFADLATANQTIHDLCEQPSITPVQLGIALNRLADWHLKLAHDPVAARHVLERLCARLPHTHLDKMARQRINQLPATREALLERERGKPMHLPQVPDEMDAPPPQKLPREQAVQMVSECVNALTMNPDDVTVREKFARLVAESLDDRKTAIEQLELLLAMQGQPADKRAAWLLVIAGWHARDNLETAKLVYQEVMRDFPNTSHAFAAQRRLNLINLQSQFRRRAAGRAATV